MSSLLVVTILLSLFSFRESLVSEEKRYSFSKLSVRSDKYGWHIDCVPKTYFCLFYGNDLFLGRNWNTREKGKFLITFTDHFILSLNRGNALMSLSRQNNPPQPD